MSVRMLGCVLLLLLSACGGANEVANEVANDTPSPPTTSANNTNEAPEPAGNRESPPTPEPPPVPAPVDQDKAEYVAFEGGLRAYPAKHLVELDAWLLGSQTRPLEYVLVSPGGNTHESLFATAASGLHLKRALEIIGLQEGKEKRNGRGYLDKPTGDRVKISVRFHHAETGALTTVRIEDWLWDHYTDSILTPEGWIFTGSFEQYRESINRSLFEADMKGNLIGMWRDSSCVLDNGRDDAWRPDIYSPHPEADGIPKANRSETPEVTLIFEPQKDE